MAKSKFKIEKLDKGTAEEQLTELRSGRGGRTSKYQPILEEAKELGKGNALKVEVAKNEVGGLRGYLNRHLGEHIAVRSSKVENGKYVAFIFNES